MKIFITGGNGQLAYDVIAEAKLQGLQWVAPSHQELDITDANSVFKKISEFQPDIVINAAAYTQVDQAEDNIEAAISVNCNGAKNLAIACEKLKIPLIHISTDYIFDGNSQRPYQETDQVMPLNIYGDSKWQGEQAIREVWDKHIILRVSGVFGVHGHNFVKTILRLAREREEIKIVADQFLCPTPSRAIAKTILTIMDKPKYGTYHYCSSMPTHWHGFANAIVELAKNNQILKVKKVTAITTAEYPVRAVRPAYSVLDCEKIKKTFGIEQPCWQAGLGEVIHALSTT